MNFRATLIPKEGPKVEQAFCVSLEEAKTWARRTLWLRHRKLVQQFEKKAVIKDARGFPYVAIVEIRPVPLLLIHPWDVTDEDKKDEP